MGGVWVIARSQLGRYETPRPPLTAHFFASGDLGMVTLEYAVKSPPPNPPPPPSPTMHRPAGQGWRSINLTSCPSANILR